MSVDIITGNCLKSLELIVPGTFQMCVTSPPYFGLRDYGNPEQIGLEKSPEEFIEKLVDVFRGVRHALRDDGTLFLNLGDSYYAKPSGERRAISYGSGDRAPKDSRSRDCLCGSLCDACRVAYRTGRAHSVQQPASMPLPSLAESIPARRESSPVRPPTSDSAHLDYRIGDATEHPAPAPGHEVEQPLDALASMSHESAPLPPESRSVASTQDAECRLCGRSFSRLVRESARTLPDQSAPRSVSVSTPDHGTSKRDTPLTDGASFQGTTDMVCDCSPPRNVAAPSARLKPKDLIGIPWRVALALQADGWYLRSDIIWAKPNPMPESVTDRPTRSHEYLFLLTKSERYYYDADAIAEPAIRASEAQWAGETSLEQGKENDTGVSTRRFKKGGSGNLARKPGSARGCPEGARSNVAGSVPWEGVTKNKRDVWTVPSQPFKGAHFATFPPALIEPCILAGSARKGAYEPIDYIDTPLGEDEEGDPSLLLARAGMGRPRAEDAGTRRMSRDEQRGYAMQLRDWDGQRRAAMELACGPEAFAHYVRTDRSGARPIPPDHLEAWIGAGWLTRVEPPTPTLVHASRSRVLDPFGGAGTTGIVCDTLDRDATLLELNPEYADMARRRIDDAAAHGFQEALL